MTDVYAAKARNKLIFVTLQRKALQLCLSRDGGTVGRVYPQSYRAPGRELCPQTP